MIKHLWFTTRRSVLTASVIVFGLGLVLWIPPPATSAVPALRPRVSEYVLLGWNDLGMHCMNESFANLAVLPPYNNLWAQVVHRGSPPQIVTGTISVTYSILNNTFSACQSTNCKSDFWQNAQALFNLSSPLADNVGLTGATLAGTMHKQSDHYAIEGVPLTPYRDTPLPYTSTNWYPYQQAYLVATDTGTGQIVIDTTTVAPVSTEMRCDTCHADGKEPGGNTGNVETNVLTYHDEESGTTLMSQRPVLCAKCHGSNALGMAGDPNLPNLSRAMHSKHAEVTNNCYYCHPGQVTRCLRDVMWSRGLGCTDCHGNMSTVANPSRRPWIDVPRCGSCHNAPHAENANKRYRDSVGHGGLYCEACHGSPHAILPTIQANDNIQSIAYQGYSGVIRDCTVCHTATPQGIGPHGVVSGPATYFPLIKK